MKLQQVSSTSCLPVPSRISQQLPVLLIVTLTVNLFPHSKGFDHRAFPQWALIELARRPEVQVTLRGELLDSFAAGEDPTYDHLMNDLPYLDAFTCELLRLHLPEPQTMREVRPFPSFPPAFPYR